MKLLYSNLYNTNNEITRIEGHSYGTEEEYNSHKNMWLKAGFNIDCEICQNDKWLVRYIRTIKK